VDSGAGWQEGVIDVDVDVDVDVTVGVGVGARLSFMSGSSPEILSVCVHAGEKSCLIPMRHAQLFVYLSCLIYHLNGKPRRHFTGREGGKSGNTSNRALAFFCPLTQGLSD
jgi:hypothetical protein